MVDGRTRRKIENDKSIMIELAETIIYANEMSDPFVNAGKRLSKESESFK